MTTGVALIGQVARRGSSTPASCLIGLGWSALSTTGITTTVAPWFERHQGRSMTLAIMGASVGAIVGVPLLLLPSAELGLGGGLLAAGVAGGRRAAAARRGVLRFRGPEEIGQQRDGGARWLKADAARSRAAGRDARQPVAAAVERRSRLRPRPHGADRLHHPSRDGGRTAAGTAGGGPAGQRHRAARLRRPPDPGAHRRRRAACGGWHAW